MLPECLHRHTETHINKSQNTQCNLYVVCLRVFCNVTLLVGFYSISLSLTHTHIGMPSQLIIICTHTVLLVAVYQYMHKSAGHWTLTDNAANFSSVTNLIFHHCHHFSINSVAILSSLAMFSFSLHRFLSYKLWCSFWNAFEFKITSIMV